MFISRRLKIVLKTVPTNRKYGVVYFILFTFSLPFFLLFLSLFWCLVYFGVTLTIATWKGYFCSELQIIDKNVIIFVDKLIAKIMMKQLTEENSINKYSINKSHQTFHTEGLHLAWWLSLQNSLTEITINLIFWTFINYYHLTAWIKIQPWTWKLVVDGGTPILHIPI